MHRRTRSAAVMQPKPVPSLEDAENYYAKTYDYFNGERCTTKTFSEQGETQPYFNKNTITK